MKINRDELLKVLELVQFGVPPRETVSFSKSFIFRRGYVFSYDDEVLCRAPLKQFKGITGAVDAQRLLGILRKLTDVAQLNVEQKNGELIITDNKDKHIYLSIQKIDGEELPADQVEEPEASEWKELGAGFDEAVKLAQDCAKEKDSTFSRTCVQFTPKYIQAYDNYQMIQYRIKIKTSEPFLVRKEAIKNIATLGMHEFAETENWVHFRGPSGLVYSCRRWLEDYPDLQPYFETEGKSIELPKGLERVIDCANEFSQELADANRVQVEIKKGRVIVTGFGITGRYVEKVEASSYKGREYAFLISPNLLTNIVKKSQTVQITDNELIVQGEDWKYLAVLVKPEEVEMLHDAGHGDRCQEPDDYEEDEEDE